MPPVERRHRHDRARTLHTWFARRLGFGYQLSCRFTTRQWPRAHKTTGRGGHRSCTKICASSPSENSALPTRAPQASKAQPRATNASPEAHCAEVRLLPPRPGRRGHVARALHHAGGGRRPGHRRALAPGSAWKEHRAGSSLRCACSKNRTRGYAAEIQRRRGRSSTGLPRDGSRPRPVGRVLLFSINSGCVAFCPSAFVFGLCIVSSGRNT